MGATQQVLVALVGDQTPGGVDDALLKEDGDGLLLETGDAILLED